MHDEDVRMIERARGASLLFKAMQPIGIGRESRRQNLDRNIAAQSGIARAIHLTHPARTKWSDYFVRAKFRAGESVTSSSPPSNSSRRSQARERSVRRGD